MTIFKVLLMAALSTLCAVADACEPKAWDVVLTENQQELDTHGHFVASDDNFHYLGFLFVDEDLITAESSFLLAFQDRVFQLLDRLCQSKKRAPTGAYRLNFPFTKNVVSQDSGDVFVATLQTQLLRREAADACTL